MDSLNARWSYMASAGQPRQWYLPLSIESTNEHAMSGAARLSLNAPEPLPIGESAYRPGLRIAHPPSEQRINKRRNR